MIALDINMKFKCLYCEMHGTDLDNILKNGVNQLSVVITAIISQLPCFLGNETHFVTLSVLLFYIHVI